MRSRKTFASVCSLLTVALVAAGLFAWSGQVLKGAQNSDRNPRSLLQLPATPPRVLPAAASGVGPSDDYRRYITTQSALMRSNLVLSRAVSAPQIQGLASIKSQPDPIEWLRRNLEVT